MSTTVTTSRTVVTTIVEGNKTTTITEVTVSGDPAALEKAKLEMETIMASTRRIFENFGDFFDKMK